MTLLQHIINCGLTYSDEGECYSLTTSPFTTLSVVFNADKRNVDVEGNTLILLNDVDEEGNWFDSYEEFSPDDEDNAISFFDEVYSEMTRDDTSQLKRGVGVQKCLQKLNDKVGEELFTLPSL